MSAMLARAGSPSGSSPRNLPRQIHVLAPGEQPQAVSPPAEPSGQACELRAQSGLVLNPVTGRWHLDERDTDINYIMFATVGTTAGRGSSTHHKIHVQP